MLINFDVHNGPRQELARIRAALRHRGLDRRVAAVALAGVLAGVCAVLIGGGMR